MIVVFSVTSDEDSDEFCLLCIVIPLAIIIAILLALLVVAILYAILRLRTPPRTNLKNKAVDGLNGYVYYITLCQMQLESLSARE